MEHMIYIQFICMCAPLLLSIPLIKKSSRGIMVFILVGIAVSLFISEVNSAFLKLLNNEVYLVTTTITPVTEEIVKALPVLLYAFVFTDKRESLLTAAFSVGIGFALFENTYILTQTATEVTVSWALIRGFSTALMHGICTAAIGFGLSLIRKKRKLCITGTISLLLLAVTYHGIFNMLVQSETYKYFGFFLPAFTYIPILVVQVKAYKKRKALQ